MISIFDHGMMERNRKRVVINWLRGEETRKAATLPDFQVLRCKESSLESLYIFHLNPGISRFHLTREEKKGCVNLFDFVARKNGLKRKNVI